VTEYDDGVMSVSQVTAAGSAVSPVYVPCVSLDRVGAGVVTLRAHCLCAQVPVALVFQLLLLLLLLFLFIYIFYTLGSIDPKQD